MRPYQTRFRFGYTSIGLTLPTTLTRQPMMQKVRGRAFRLRRIGIALPQIVDIRFQVLFHSPNRGAFHLSLAVLYAIGRWQIFRLGEWSPQIPAGFHVSCGTQELLEPLSLSSTGVSPSVLGLSRPFD